MRKLETLLMAAVLVGACGRAGPEPDPTYDGPFVTMEDVDDSLAAHVTGDRSRATYGPGDAIKGAAQPTVTIVEWSDFQCPFCGQFAETLDELSKAYPDDVRIVFKQFPLPMHPDAALGAKAAIAAQQQGRFWAMHDLLFRNRQKMKRENLLGYAAELGLDVAKFEADLDAPATEERLEREKMEGRRLGVRGTPTFFINGLPQSGAIDPAKLRDIVEKERAVARALISAGAEPHAVYAHIMRAAMPGGAGRNPSATSAADGS